MSQKGCMVYLWRCTVCGVKYYGKNPPNNCKNCSSEANRYILIPKETPEGTRPEIENYLGMPGLNNILYLVGTVLEGRVNAMCCNSVTQVTFYPPRIAVAVNKYNLTHDYIKETGVFSLSPLAKSQSNIAHFFGRNSGRQVNKFESYEYKKTKSGSPIIQGCLGYYDCQVEHSSTMDLGTHTLFIGQITDAVEGGKDSSLTYFDYCQDMLKS